jgi:mono/diheme cytochrome c family protein
MRVVLLVLLVGCARAESREGGELFGSVCARCHGADGKGGLAQPGQPAPRNFRDAAFQAARTDDQLRAVIRGGKGAAMPPFAAVLNDRQIDALVATVRSFDPGRRP